MSNMSSYKKSNPWASRLSAAKTRCNNKNCRVYKRYGGRGIKCFLTMAQVRTLWIVDSADSMKKASIDRIDSNGDYIFSNCRFIEHWENSMRPKIDRWRAMGLDVTSTPTSTMPCAVCGTEFTRPLSDIRRQSDRRGQTSIYCSNRCSIRVALAVLHKNRREEVWTMTELESSVLAAINNGYTTFTAIDTNSRKLGVGTFRHTDRAIQKLRRRGIIHFERGHWYAVQAALKEKFK